MGHRAPVGPAGFTLLELVVTLLVLAVAAALVGPVVGRSVDTVRARAEVAGFAAMLRHAREQAIAAARPHTLVVEPLARRVRIVADPEDEVASRPLAPDLRVEAEPAPALRVRFEPHGASTGGAFRLTTGGVRYRVSVDPLTGRVRATRE